MRTKTLGLRSRFGAWVVPALTAWTLLGLAIPLPSAAQEGAFSGVHVLTHHNDNARTGLNAQETILKPGEISANTFGKVFTRSVQGAIYAQPLYVSNVPIPGKGLRNCVYVVTARNHVYCFDADRADRDYVRAYWHIDFNDNFLEIGPVPSLDVLSQDITPEIGIIGTPVIDLESQTIFLVVKSKEVETYYQRIHALDLITGQEKEGSPVEISAVVPGIGDGSEIDDEGNSFIPFYTLKQNQRPALLLSNGVLWISWASHGDNGPYHGWVLAYNAQTLEQIAKFNTTPDGGLGGIWQSGAGPAADYDGNVYFMTGNGTFSAREDLGGQDYGDSIVKLSMGEGGLSVSDFFTPFNEEDLSAADIDLGSGGVLLLPESVGSEATPRLLVGAGKEGKIYLVNRDNMGRFNFGFDDVVQSLPDAVGGVWGMPAYFNGHIYFQGVGDTLKAFSIENALLSPGPVSASRRPVGYPGDIGYPGTTPSISANENEDGIVWTIDPYYSGSGPLARLMAYNATNLRDRLFSSFDAGTRDSAGSYVKFSVPTVANGKVFVGGNGALSVYGKVTNPGPATASSFLITGPLLVFPYFPFISQNVGYHFSVTALGPDGTPIKLNSKAYGFLYDGYGYKSIGSITFNNSPNAVIYRPFPIVGVYDLVVTDNKGHFGARQFFNIPSPLNPYAQGGLDHFIVRMPRTAKDNEVVSVNIRAVTAKNTPVQVYGLNQQGLPVPLFLAVYDTLPDGIQDDSPILPGYAYDLDQPNADTPARMFFQSQITVRVTVRGPGKHVFIVTDGLHTGTAVVEVPQPRNP